MLIVVINWSRDVGLSQIDVRCLRLQIWQPERHLHSAARCRLPVQLKQIFSDLVATCGLWLSQTCYNSQLWGQLRHSRHTLFVMALFRLHKMFFLRSQNLAPCFPALSVPRSAFTPFSLSSTLLTFPVTSFNLPSVSKDCTLLSDVISNTLYSWSFLYSSLSCIQPITSGLAEISRGKCRSPLIKVTLTELSISNLRHAFTLN